MCGEDRERIVGRDPAIGAVTQRHTREVCRLGSVRAVRRRVGVVQCLAAHTGLNHTRKQRIAVIDFGIADAELDEASKPEIIQLADWLHAEWKQGKSVAGKCQAGLNRSSLIVALVLLKEGYTATEAIELIRKKRSEYALFNNHFVEFIHEVFKREFEESTVSA